MADDLDAKARLEEAVGRLEGALGGIVERANASGGDIDKLSRRVGDLESELTSLRDERDRLAGELDASRAGQSSMQEAMDAVSTRLDKAIVEIKTVLDG